MDKYGKANKLSSQILRERGYVHTYHFGVGNVVYDKWGLEVTVGMEDYYFEVRTPDKGRYNIHYEHELEAIESRLGVIDKPNMWDMSIEELKALIPDGYNYVLDETKPEKPSPGGSSYDQERGRYKMLRGDKIVSEGYNDEGEQYFLMRSILFVLGEEGLLPIEKEIIIKDLGK